MALTKITYTDKVSLEDQPSVAEVNKVTDANMNEIKTIVNAACDQIDENTDNIAILDERISELETIKTIIDIVYPVGSIYISYASTNPGTLWPGTTWAREAEGRCIIGLGTGYPTAGAEGGSTSVSLSHTHKGPSHTHSVSSHSHTVNSHSHSTANHTLTINEIPSHNHRYFRQRALYDEPISPDSNTAYASATTTTNRKTEVYTYNTGGGGAHNHGNTGASSPGTNSAGGGRTGSSGTGNTGSALGSTSIMQPYVVMYIWRRTA